jgi:WD40 repeat protein
MSGTHENSIVAPPLIEMDRWTGHRAGVKAIAASPNGRWTASADCARQIVLWKDGSPFRTFEPFAFWERFPSSRQVFDIAFSLDSHLLFVAASDRIYAYMLEDGRLAWRFRGPRLWAFLPSNPLGIAVSPASGELAAGFDDGHMGIWSAGGGCKGFWFDDQAPRRLAYTRAGLHIVGSDLYSICIWETASHAKIARHMCQGRIHCLEISPLDDIAVTRDLHRIRLWRHESGAELASWVVEPGMPLVQFSPTERLLAYSSGNRLIVCDFAGFALAEADSEGSRLLSLSFSFDGTSILAGYDDGVIRRFQSPSD